MTAWRLFTGFLRVGLFGFGGGPSMLPLMQTEVVGAGFVTDQQFLDGLAVGNTLPGPIAVKMAVYVGWSTAGAPGAAASLAGVCLPALALMLGLTGVLLRYRDRPWMASALVGARAAVVGMLFWVAWDLGRKSIDGWGPGVLAVASFVALALQVHPAIVMLAALIVGVAVFPGGAA